MLRVGKALIKKQTGWEGGGECVCGGGCWLGRRGQVEASGWLLTTQPQVRVTASRPSLCRVATDPDG